MPGKTVDDRRRTIRYIILTNVFSSLSGNHQLSRFTYTNDTTSLMDCCFLPVYKVVENAFLNGSLEPL